MVHCYESGIVISTPEFISVALGTCLFLSCSCERTLIFLFFVFFASCVDGLVSSDLPLPIVLVDGVRRLGYSQLSITLSRQWCVFHSYFTY